MNYLLATREEKKKKRKGRETQKRVFFSSFSIYNLRVFDRRKTEQES